MMTRLFSTVLMLFALMGLPDQASAQDNPLHQKIQVLAWKQAPARGATNCNCADTTPTKWPPWAQNCANSPSARPKTAPVAVGRGWLGIKGE